MPSIFQARMLNLTGCETYSQHDSWFSAAPRWIFLFILAYAPWAYGCTREWAASALDGLLAIAALMWILEAIALRRMPRPGWLFAVTAALIIALGWSSALLGLAGEESWFERYEGTPVEDFILDFGTIDWGISARDMTHVTLMLAAMMFLVDGFRSRGWIQPVFVTMALTGVSIGLLGILQRVFGGPFNLVSEDRSAYLGFATFRYWGNAGAFLNLVWPAAFALAASAFRARSKASAASGLLGAVLCGIAVFANQSKATTALGALGMILFASGLLLVSLRKRRGGEFQMLWYKPVIIAVPLLVMLSSLMILVPWQRWKTLAGSTSFDLGGRLPAYEKFWKRVEDAGWMGNGPGTFAETHRAYFDKGDAFLTGFRAAHQDYIETLIEWGWSGFSIWSALVAGGILGLIKLTMTPVPGALLGGAGLIAIGLTLAHSMVDFPMQIPSIQVYFIAWLALGLAALQHSQERLRLP